MYLEVHDLNVLLRNYLDGAPEKEVRFANRVNLDSMLLKSVHGRLYKVLRVPDQV